MSLIGLIYPCQSRWLWIRAGLLGWTYEVWYALSLG